MTEDDDFLGKTQSDGTPRENAEPPSHPKTASAPPARVAPRTRDEADARPKPQPRSASGGDEDYVPSYLPPESRPSRPAGGSLPLIMAATGIVLVLIMCGIVASATSSAGRRLVDPHAEDAPQVAIADQAEVDYCTPQFKQVLQRVLHACGLEGGNSRHGCQPSDVKSFASISDEDFNALFKPLKDRGAVLLFDNAADELDEGAKKLLEERFLDRKGARYFFAVARASKVGSQAKNRALSHRRANSVKFHVQSLLPDPDLDKKFGQLWLGDEFAQLSEDFCSWPNSRPNEKCDAEAVNRSVFVSWVDCRL